MEFANGVLNKFLPLSRQWDIHYGGFLFNHLTHKWIVLSKLALNSAEMDFQMAKWKSIYENHTILNARLEPARPVTETMPKITNETINYPAYLEYFDEVLKTTDIPTAIRIYVPTLARGLVGSALHSAIHVGFGADVGSKSVVAEGLAALCTTYTPLGSPEPDVVWTEGPVAFIDLSMRMLCESRDKSWHLRSESIANSAEYQEIGVGIFQTKILTFNDDLGGLREELNSFCPLPLPSDNQRFFSALVVEATTWTSAAFYHSDSEFFVLHVATSLHALLCIVGFLSSDDQRAAFAYWWRAAVATVAVQDPSPYLDDMQRTLEEWRESTRKSELGEGDAIKSECSADVYNECASGQLPDEWWEAALEEAAVDNGEHTVKGVYALWRWSLLPGMPPASTNLFKRTATRLNEKAKRERQAGSQ